MFFDIEYYFVLLVSKQFFVLINELEKMLFDIEYYFVLLVSK